MLFSSEKENRQKLFPAGADAVIRGPRTQPGRHAEPGVPARRPGCHAEPGVPARGRGATRSSGMLRHYPQCPDTPRQGRPAPEVSRAAFEKD